MQPQAFVDAAFGFAIGFKVEQATVSHQLHVGVDAAFPGPPRLV